jgi:hypothetical protein
MKKFNFGLSTGLLIGFLLFSIPALADGLIKANLLVNGQSHKADLILVDGKTYVPLRQFSELIGYKVDWNQKTSTVSLNNGGGNSNNINVGNTSNEVNKNYTIKREEEFTIVKFNDGLEITFKYNTPKIVTDDGGNPAEDSNKIFYILIENNSTKPIHITSDMFKYINNYDIGTDVKACYNCKYYINNITIYPETYDSGLLLFTDAIPLKYLIFDDGVHYAEISNITTSNLSDDIDVFCVSNMSNNLLN